MKLDFIEAVGLVNSTEVWVLRSAGRCVCGRYPRASVPEVPGLMCHASSVEGPAYMVTTGQKINVVGAKPGSVIHVGCW